MKIFVETTSYALLQKNMFKREELGHKRLQMAETVHLVWLAHHSVINLKKEANRTPLQSDGKEKVEGSKFLRYVPERVMKKRNAEGGKAQHG